MFITIVLANFLSLNDIQNVLAIIFKNKTKPILFLDENTNNLVYNFNYLCIILNIVLGMCA